MQKVLTKSQLPATTGDPSSHDISIYFHPERVICIILLDIVYNPLGLPFYHEAMLEMTEKQLGRALFAYWQPFTAPDGPENLLAHVESLWTALRAADDKWMKVVFCTWGAPKKVSAR
jgi:hypothetical protein